MRDGGFVGVIVNEHPRRVPRLRAGGRLLRDGRRARRPSPSAPACRARGSGSFQDFRLVEQVGRFLDVTSGVAALVFGGRLEQYPELNIVAVTAGGAIGLLAARLDQAYQPRHWGGKPGNGGGPPSGGPPRRTATGRTSAGRPTGRRAAGNAAVREQDHAAAERLPSPRLRRYGELERAEPAGEPRGHGRRADAVRDRLAPLATPLEDAIAAVRNLPISDDDKADPPRTRSGSSASAAPERSSRRHRRELHPEAPPDTFGARIREGG